MKTLYFQALYEYMTSAALGLTLSTVTHVDLHQLVTLTLVVTNQILTFPEYCDIFHWIASKPTHRCEWVTVKNLDTSIYTTGHERRDLARPSRQKNHNRGFKASAYQTLSVLTLHCWCRASPHTTIDFALLDFVWPLCKGDASVSLTGKKWFNLCFNS